MFANLRKCFSLLDRRAKGWLTVVVVVAVAVSLTEALSALLLVSLLAPIAQPGRPLSLPGLGPLEERFPDAGTDALFAAAAVAVGLFFVVRGLLYVLQVFLQQRTTQQVGVRLSDRLIAGYLAQPYVFHLKRNSADLIRRALQSATSVSSIVLYSYVVILSELLLIAALFGLLLVRAPMQTLVLLAVVWPVVYGSVRGVQKALTNAGKRNLVHYSTALQSLQQSFEMLREIRVLRRGEYFQRKFVTARAQHARNTYVSTTLSEVPRAVLETVLVITVLAFLVIAYLAPGGNGDGDGDGGITTLALFGYTALRILPGASRVVTSINRIRLYAPALDDVHDDLALLRSSAAASAAAEPAESRRLAFSDALVLDHVGFRYTDDGRPVLRDVSLTVRAGESVGFVGPTGAGKSTLVDIVLGLLTPTSGRVTADGIDVHAHPAAWQANVGLVPQSIVLLDDTLRRNIALGLDNDEIDEQLLAAAISMSKLEDVVSGLEDGLETTLGERGVRLSGGQRQRVAIARALYRQPPVLIFDEGTSSLDTITEREILSALERLHGERTMITVAHRLATVRACDHIYLIDGGTVADVGTYDELSQRSGQFREMTL